MPIKFLCDQCNAKLQVATRKVGTEQTCPRCQQQIIIPEPEVAEAMLAMKTSDRFSEEGQEDEFLEFAIYDDEELVYESEEEQLKNSPRVARVDPNRISLPRIVLYIQGALLGVVACMFFVFGVMVGKYTSLPEPSSASTSLRCRVVGQVHLASNNGGRPDTGALVILIPKDRRPDPRPNVAQLQPGIEVDIDDPDQQLIREIGGAVGVVAENGSFEIVATSPRDYYLLVVSNNRRRPAERVVTREQRATMGAYFVPVEDLLGQQSFLWQEITLSGSSYEVDPIDF